MVINSIIGRDVSLWYRQRRSQLTMVNWQASNSVFKSGKKASGVPTTGFAHGYLGKFNSLDKGWFFELLISFLKNEVVEIIIHEIDFIREAKRFNTLFNDRFYFFFPKDLCCFYGRSRRHERFEQVFQTRK